jgi:hypothetical protein
MSEEEDVNNASSGEESEKMEESTSRFGPSRFLPSGEIY